MAIDAERKRPILSTVTGGMSGAAVKPIALRMVWQVAKAVNIPVIGLGGIMNWKDAVEFMLAGASAIQIGKFHRSGYHHQSFRWYKRLPGKTRMQVCF